MMARLTVQFARKFDPPQSPLLRRGEATPLDPPYEIGGKVSAAKQGGSVVDQAEFGGAWL